MTVNILSPEIAEHIAAGEVVENPASVVKELAENALDAGTDRVEVMVQNGGLQSIQVVDNGEGIDFNDLPVIFQRYATSKIARLEDLTTIATLGFRGEALPSIAAVSKVTLTGRRRAETSGGRIRVEGGKVASIEEIGAPEGTAVLVEDLFYNTPARLKFLKSPPVETSRISFLLWELSLGNPQISFSLHSNGRNLLRTSGDGSLAHILGAIHGLECARSLLPLNHRSENYSVEISGCISAPYYHRSSRRGITIVVNGRVVKAPGIAYALERGYGNLLPRGRYPVAVIRIQLPPDLLDVNVHPSKTTVRFQQTEVLSDLVYRSVKSTLGKQLPLPYFKTPGEAGSELPGDGRVGSHISSLKSIYRSNSEIDSRVEERESLPGLQLRKKSDETRQQGALGDFFSEPGTEIQNIRLIGQFLHSYLVAQRGEELLVIDQHAAHERVLYHKLNSALLGQQVVQLTLPLEMEIPAPWREQFAELQNTLQEMGFKLEPFGDNNYIIRQLPVLPKGEMSHRDIHDLIEELLLEEPEPGLGKREQVCRSIACRQAIKAKQMLTRQEMETLLAEWLATPGYQCCPHGRPSIMSFHRSELDKLFRRKGER